MARESSLSGSISGTMPYLAGLKKVEWTAMRKRVASMSSILPDQKAKKPTVTASISKAFVMMRTVLLLKTSETYPA